VYDITRQRLLLLNEAEPNINEMLLGLGEQGRECGATEVNAHESF
jgi:hypothetical protein